MIGQWKWNWWRGRDRRRGERRMNKPEGEFIILIPYGQSLGTPYVRSML